MGDGYGGKWVAEERIRPWEASLPDGTDHQFIAALAAQTPNAWATPLLVGLNGLAFVAMTIGGVDALSPAAADLIRWGADYGPLTTGGEPSRLLLSAFLNFGALQIGLNMLVLWNAGFVIERLVGSWGLLIAYLVSAVCGSVASIAWNPPCRGAGCSRGGFGGVRSLHRLPLREPWLGAVRGGGAVAGSVRARRSSWEQFGMSSIRRHPGKCFGPASIWRGLGRPSDRRLLRPRPGASSSGHRPRTARSAGGSRSWEVVSVVAAIALALSRLRTVDLRVEMAERSYVMQAKTSDLYQSARWKRQARRLSDADFVKIVDEQVRPPWRDHLKRLQGLQRLRGKVRERVVLTEAYLDTQRAELGKGQRGGAHRSCRRRCGSSRSGTAGRNAGAVVRGPDGPGVSPLLTGIGSVGIRHRSSQRSGALQSRQKPRSAQRRHWSLPGSAQSRSISSLTPLAESVTTPAATSCKSLSRPRDSLRPRSATDPKSARRMRNAPQLNGILTFGIALGRS